MRGYKKRPKGHNIHYVLPNGRKQTLAADVYNGKQAIALEVGLADLERASSLGGVGTTQACMMAVCSERHSDVVPHPFIFVEWTDNMAYFITEMKLGRRAKCVAYTHNDKLAAQFDNPKERRALRKRLTEEGKIIVRLSPPRQRESRAGMGAPKGRLSAKGERTHVSKSRGHFRRLERSIPFLQEAQLLQQKNG